MQTAVLACRAVLAAVLVTAAIGKLLDLPGSRRALVDFGVRQERANLLGTLLPLGELALAIALVFTPTAQWAGAAALALFLTFIGVMVNALAHGKAPDCHCFGALFSSKTGPRAIARNAVFAGIAGVIAVTGPGPSITAWVGDRSPVELVSVGAGIGLVLLGALAVRLWLENRELSAELDAAEGTVATIPPGLAVGTMAPAFAVPDGNGGTLSLDALRSRGLPVFLVFVRAGCGPSEVLLPSLEQLSETVAGKLTIGLVGTGSVARYLNAGDLSLAEAVEADPGLRQEIDDLYELFHAYRLPATPSAVVVTREGTIGSATVHGRPAIEALLRLTLGRTALRPAPVGLEDAVA